AVAPGTVPPPAGPHFSLGHAETTRTLLEIAGFTGVTFTDVDEPVCYGPDSATATEFALGLKDVQELAGAEDATEDAAERLRAAFAAHETPDGVVMGSRAWIVTAVSRG
ncbi:MAG: hypothetical protein QOI78_8965, partial [Actinomycetota bacterium]|nr:hypothetical protein [Actinomycetota bacterium]